MATNRLSLSTSAPSVQFYLQADELSNDPVTNKHVVRCYLVAINRGNTSTFYSGTGAVVTGSVDGNAFSVSGNDAKLASGTPNGAAFWTHGPYDITVDGDADGTATADLGLSVSYPSVSGGGSTSGTLTLAKLTTVPGVPTGVSLVRNSDSQATVSWADTSPSNGQPTSDQIRTSVNGAAFSQIASIAPASSLVIAVAGNQKILAQVRATNSAGSSAWSASSNAIFTTPAAPTGVAATKDASLDITVAWTPNVGFAEHQHVIEHGTVTGGVTTWDGSPLATVAAATSSFKHVAPNPAQVHVYRVSAKNTDTGALQSAKVLSNQVQLLVAPNKPTLPAIAPFADKAAAYVFGWTHNPADTTPQSAYEVEYSTNGGSSWTSTGKVASTTSSKTFAAGTYTAGQQLTLRVRTWGQATTGGSDGAGASPWSDLAAVTFKTRPVVTITGPVDAGTYEQAALNVQLGFAQAEGATFVSASIGLYEGATLLEQLASTTLASTVMTTRVANGGAYTVKVTVLDSNGLTSALAESDFAVEYTEPVAAAVTATYLEDSGIGQLALTIPDPGVGEVAAVSVSITRRIDEVTETVVNQFPVEASLTFPDWTPTIHGDNVYTVTTISADGATTEVDVTMSTAENQWAFLSRGSDIIRFFGNINFGASPSVDTVVKPMAGRKVPIALFGENTSLVVDGSATIFTSEGSSVDEVEKFLLKPGVVCYRDPSPRRMFGALFASQPDRGPKVSGFQYRVVEAS